MGSFLSVSSAQMDEIAAGLRESGVRFIWVARGETGRLKEVCGDMEFSEQPMRAVFEVKSAQGAIPSKLCCCGRMSI
ncbi:unnamed protein product [Prunus armeniaca]